MDWYCNLPEDLLLCETTLGGDGADFILVACHAVLVLLLSVFREEGLVRSEIERSRGIIGEGVGRMGSHVQKFGVFVAIAGEIARRAA